MALSTQDAFSTGRRGRRRRGRRGALSEINVTPLVDVMLVLLIVFMISAPLLTAGVPVELPKTDAAPVDSQVKPLTVSVQQDGRTYVGDAATTLDDLPAALQGQSKGNVDQPVFVRADGRVSYAVVAQVMARLATSGFTHISLITDTGGPEGRGRRRPGTSTPP